MAFTGTLSVSQSSDFTSLTITDTSSYSSEPQGNFSTRRVYLYKIDGTTLVPSGTTTSYIDFPFGLGSSITITGVLNTDYALLINGVWVCNSPQPGSTYTSSGVYGFDNYLQQFYSGQISNLSDNPSVLNDTNWYTDLSKLQTELDNISKAVSDGQQYSAQSAINRATYLMTNSQFFF